MEFARKTGDLRELSRVDLHVLALTYQLEVEVSGGKHLRQEPLARGATVRRVERTKGGAATSAAVQASGGGAAISQIETEEVTSDAGKATEAPAGEAAGAAAGGSSAATEGADGDAVATTEVSGGAAAVEAAPADAPASAAAPKPAAVAPPKPMTRGWAAVAASAPSVPVEATKSKGPRVVKDLVTSTDPVEEETSELGASASSAPAEVEATGGAGDNAAQPQRGTYTSRVLTGGGGAAASREAMSRLAEEDDGQGWIGPGDVTSKGGVAGGPWGVRARTTTASVRVGCVTTDYAMQNVLLQMGLSLLTVDGRAIDRVKQWVLKCDSCFKITTEMTRMFCPVCGNATLARLGVTLDSKGKPRYHYKRNRVVKTTGSKHSLPAARGGRDGDLLLREDQLLVGQWRQKSHKKTSGSSMFDPYGEGRGGTRVGEGVVVGYGRRNPNALRGRERRGQKKSKRPGRR